jgi:hypothetical protein
MQKPGYVLAKSTKIHLFFVQRTRGRIRGRRTISLAMCHFRQVAAADG